MRRGSLWGDEKARGEPSWLRSVPLQQGSQGCSLPPLPCDDSARGHRLRTRGTRALRTAGPGRLLDSPASRTVMSTLLLFTHYQTMVCSFSIPLKLTEATSSSRQDCQSATLPLLQTFFTIPQLNNVSLVHPSARPLFSVQRLVHASLQSWLHVYKYLGHFFFSKMLNILNSKCKFINKIRSREE